MNRKIARDLKFDSFACQELSDRNDFWQEIDDRESSNYNGGSIIIEPGQGNFGKNFVSILVRDPSAISTLPYNTIGEAVSREVPEYNLHALI